MDDDVAGKVRKFFENYPLRTFEKGQVIVQAEEDPPGVFYMREGRVNQYDISPAGINIVVNVFKPGAFFPMSWAMNHTPNHYFLEAADAVRAHVAPPEDAVRFVRENPEVAYDLLSRVYRGVEGVLRRSAHLMGGDAKTRLLFELINSAYRFGKKQDNGSVFVPLKEGDIARQSGLARETVNRTLQRLKQEGYATVEHRGITIADVGKLEQLLGSGL
jgi:CRP/FNR family cyclic AMP-dependent transcriptional regulator